MYTVHRHPSDKTRTYRIISTSSYGTPTTTLYTVYKRLSTLRLYSLFCPRRCSSVLLLNKLHVLRSYPHHHRPYLLGSAPVTWPGYKTASRGSQPTDHRSLRSAALPVAYGRVVDRLRELPLTLSGSRLDVHRTLLDCSPTPFVIVGSTAGSGHGSGRRSKC